MSAWLGSSAIHLLILFSTLALGAPSPAADPCAEIAGLTFTLPALALACEKSFPFNETLRQNVLTTVSRVFDFYTFEDYYLNSPPPFQESTINIRAELSKLNTTKFAVRFPYIYPHNYKPTLVEDGL